MEKIDSWKITVLAVFLCASGFSTKEMAQTSDDLPNPTKQDLPLNVPQNKKGPVEVQSQIDEKAPPTSGAIEALPNRKNKILPVVSDSRESFFALMNQKLGKEDVKVDDLKARYPDAPKLTAIENQLTSLHDTVNNLGQVKDSELRPLQLKLNVGFNKLENDISKLERRGK